MVYYCPDCGKSYVSYPALKWHFETRHPEYFDLAACPICGAGGDGIWNSNSVYKHLAQKARENDPLHIILFTLVTKKHYGRRFARVNRLKDVGKALLSDPHYSGCFGGKVVYKG